MAMSRNRDTLVRHFPLAEPRVYPPLAPDILTSCFDVLLPPRPLIFGPWCACRAPPATRSCKPASAALLSLILLLSLSPNRARGLPAGLQYPPCPHRLAQCACKGWPCAAFWGKTARWWSNPSWRLLCLSPF